MADTRGSYHTRQGEEILAYLQAHAGNHVTAEEITRALLECGVQVGKTTVYRYLDKMQQQGRVIRYASADRQSACYAYVRESTPESQLYHMKCTHCGKVYHLDCAQLTKLAEHVEREHAFRLDYTQTVLYGQCQACARQPGNGEKPCSK